MEGRKILILLHIIYFIVGHVLLLQCRHGDQLLQEPQLHPVVKEGEVLNVYRHYNEIILCISMTSSPSIQVHPVLLTLRKHPKVAARRMRVD